MKIRLTYYFLFFCNFCIGQNVSIIKEESIKTLIGDIKINDSVCLKEIERAKKDVEKNELIYSITEIDLDDCRDIEKFRISMNDFGLKTDFKKTKHTHFKHLTSYCYEKYMNIFVKQKFGNSFIDDNLRKIDSLFVLENPNRIYSALDNYDKTLFYPNAKNLNKQHDEYEIDFFKSIEYPKKFKVKSGKVFSWTSVDFILYKNGSISDFSIETEFYNKYNNRFKKYFEREIEKFVKSVKWIPKKQHGIPVNTAYSSVVNHSSKRAFHALPRLLTALIEFGTDVVRIEAAAAAARQPAGSAGEMLERLRLAVNQQSDSVCPLLACCSCLGWQ